jgi:hypothetical protein
MCVIFIIDMFVEIGLLVIALIITLVAYIFHTRNSEIDYRNKCYTRSCKSGNSDCGVTVSGVTCHTGNSCTFEGPRSFESATRSSKHRTDPLASNVMNIRTITDSQPDVYTETVCAKGYDSSECTTWA